MPNDAATSPPADAAAADAAAAGLAGLALWKKVLLGVSLALAVGGGAMTAVAAITADDAPSAATAPEAADVRSPAGDAPSTGVPTQGFAPSGDGGVQLPDFRDMPGAPDAPGAPGPTGEPQGDGAPDAQPGPHAPNRADRRPIDIWSPLAFEMGFGFFVGFAMAFALRTFVKISLTFLGVFFFLLFGLQYAGLIIVNWDRFAELYDTVGSTLRTQFASFTDFVSGYIPAAGTTLAGLVIGFRRG
jgi:uncharacterized membrane protein (Fun14 family)